MAKKTFAQTADAIRYGEFMDEATTKLHELIAACDKSGRAGSMTLKLTLKPGSGGQMEIADEVTLKLPKEQKGTSIMFVTPEFNLTRSDPRQQELEGLRVVESRALETPARVVDNTTGELRTVAG